MTVIVKRPSYGSISISSDSNSVLLSQNTQDLITVSGGIRGEPGPQGPAGEPGAGGALGYYGAFSDYTDQYIAANTAQAMTFDTTDESLGVSIVNGSRITFAHGGTYNVQWSGQFVCTSNQDQDVSVWLKKNGVDVPGSTGVISVPSSHGATSGHTITSWNFVFTVTAGTYYEFYWSSTSNLVSLQTFPVFTSPTRPSTASLVLTVTQVMYAQTTAYFHTQGVASTTWVITHDLGFRPNVATFVASGEEVEGDIIHNSVNQCTVTFSYPISGTAALS
jgi:hypothetical protein